MTDSNQMHGNVIVWYILQDNIHANGQPDMMMEYFQQILDTNLWNHSKRVSVYLKR